MLPRPPCTAHLDPCGDHLAVCPRSGILRGGRLSRARRCSCVQGSWGSGRSQRACQGLERQNDRPIEVIANGLPLWGGAQLAVDTTLLSPDTAAGLHMPPRRAGGRTAAAALLTAKRARESNRCRLTVIAREIGGRWSAEAATFVRLLARCRARSAATLTRCRHLGFYSPLVCAPLLRCQELFRSQPVVLAPHRHGQC